MVIGGEKKKVALTQVDKYRLTALMIMKKRKEKIKQAVLLILDLVNEMMNKTKNAIII